MGEWDGGWEQSKPTKLMLGYNTLHRVLCHYLYFGCYQEWSTVNVLQHVSSLVKVQDTPQNWCLQLQIVVTESNELGIANQ